jgi:hypothetical protein
MRPSRHVRQDRPALPVGRRASRAFVRRRRPWRPTGRTPWHSDTPEQQLCRASRDRARLRRRRDPA